MPEEILPNLFRLEIPLPDNPLKYVNSYVIVGSENNLIVDTGLNRPECLAAMTVGLEELRVDLAKTRFFITHLHADHFGLVHLLVKDPAYVYFSRPETEIIESWSGWEPMIKYAARNGFPEDQLRSAIGQHPGYKYGSNWAPGMSVMDDGDIITVGDYQLVCITTPGHTPGHICLYEPNKKIFLSGDHILGDITPNIQNWSDKENNLKDYLQSLDKVKELAVDLVLPGHRSLVHDLAARVDELKEHHRRRADEVLTILRTGPSAAYDTASAMTWDLSGTWAEFPLAQKWFATAEATAHLRYLEEEGRIARRETEDKTIYQMK